MEIEKEIVHEVVWGDKHNLRKSANCKAQISTMCGVNDTDLCVAICRFSQVVFVTSNNFTHNLLFYSQKFLVLIVSLCFTIVCCQCCKQHPDFCFLLFLLLLFELQSQATVSKITINVHDFLFFFSLEAVLGSLCLLSMLMAMSKSVVRLFAWKSLQHRLPLLWADIELNRWLCSTLFLQCNRLSNRKPKKKVDLHSKSRMLNNCYRVTHFLFLFVACAFCLCALNVWTEINNAKFRFQWHCDFRKLSCVTGLTSCWLVLHTTMTEIEALPLIVVMSLERFIFSRKAYRL